ncbi:hypothetical protein OIO90_002679 [Microbotryomycetes sp. JL221]|nr:hypothetical protein OIO90_002679 [Microbotryomycetes sp. JL221]
MAGLAPSSVAFHDNKQVNEASHVSSGEKSDTSTLTSDVDSAYDWMEPSVFDDEKLASLYAPPDTWESAHRFDPKAKWTKEEDRAVLRKLDYRIFSVACLLFFSLQLIRHNIGNALSDGFLKDIGVTTNDYNLAQTLFYCSFLVAELPSQLVSKWLGVDVWVPIEIICWSIIAMSQAAITSKAGFYLTRILLGLFMGGFIPDMILFLSYSYTSSELAWRLSWFWVTLTVTNIISNLLAAGILQMRGIQGLAGWQWLFIIQGALTLVIGVFAAFWLPPSPTQTASRFRGRNGWFTAREEIIITTRVLRDDPSKSSMHNRQRLTVRDFVKSLSDFDHWPLYLIGLVAFIPVGTVNAYFTLILRSLGYSTFHTNLLLIPGAVVFIFNNVITSWASRRFNERTIFASLGSWWILFFLIALVAIPGDTNKWVKYALLSLITAWPYPHPILVSWNSRNSGSVRTRTVSAAVYNMFVQAAQIVASNIYREDDKPEYKRGNRILLGLASASIVLYAFTKVYYTARNSYKSRKWESLTADERAHYLATTTDEGNKRLDFKLAH